VCGGHLCLYHERNRRQAYRAFMPSIALLFRLIYSIIWRQSSDGSSKESKPDQ
jgi:hypothetical protein